MKKFLYTLSISLCIALSVFALVGCGGYSIDTSNLIGVWEVDSDGGATYITRIEFKQSNDTGFENQGEFSYYKDGGTTSYSGSWSKMNSSNSYSLIFSEPISGETGLKASTATLAEGKLIIQHPTSGSSSQISIYYHKVRD